MSEIALPFSFLSYTQEPCGKITMFNKAWKQSDAIETGGLSKTCGLRSNPVREVERGRVLHYVFGPCFPRYRVREFGSVCSVCVSQTWYVPIRAAEYIDNCLGNISLCNVDIANNPLATPNVFQWVFLEACQWACQCFQVFFLYLIWFFYLLGIFYIIIIWGKNSQMNAHPYVTTIAKIMYCIQQNCYIQITQNAKTYPNMRNVVTRKKLHIKICTPVLLHVHA